MFDSVLIALSKDRQMTAVSVTPEKTEERYLPCDIAQRTGIAALRQAQVSLVLCDSFITRELVAGANLLSRVSPESN